MDRIYHCHQVKLLHKEKSLLPDNMQLKILICNCSLVPAGMGKTPLSLFVLEHGPRAVCLERQKRRQHPLRLLALPLTPASPRAPALSRQERGPRPGLTCQQQSERQLCQVLRRVTGLHPLWTWTRDRGTAVWVWPRQATGPRATQLHPDPRPPAHHEVGLRILSRFVNCYNCQDGV